MIKILRSVMNLEDFPMDIQTIYMQLECCEYKKSKLYKYWNKIATIIFLVANSDRDIKFLWSENDPFQFNEALSLPDFQFDKNAIVLRQLF